MVKLDPTTFYKGQFFKAIRTFCAVVDNGSFSSAALELETSQPALSLQVQTLEQHLNTILFERKGPKIQITPAGKQLYEMARPIVESVDQLPEQFLNSQEELSYGELRIVGGETALLNLLPEILKKFCDLYPAIRIITQSTIVKEIPKLLLTDEADFAIGSLYTEHDELLFYPIFEYSPVLIIPVKHPLLEFEVEEITLREIAQYGLILPPEHSYTWWAVRFIFQQHQLACPIRLTVSSSEAAKRYVKAGLGIAIVSEACQLDDPDIKAISMEHYFPKRHYGLIQRRGKFLSPQAVKFKKLVLEVSKTL